MMARMSIMKTFIYLNWKRISNLIIITTRPHLYVTNWNHKRGAAREKITWTYQFQDKVVCGDI